MLRSITFTKMHGLGNDFIVVDDVFALAFSDGSHTRTQAPLDAELAQKMCDRRFGIGADQILWLKGSRSADFRMDILNADGSVAEMCGNGIRAAAVYFHLRVPVKEASYEIETLAGKIIAEMQGDQVRVNMGVPRLGSGYSSRDELAWSVTSGKLMKGEPLKVPGGEFSIHEVSMGNPHAVIFMDEPIGAEALKKFGPLIETHSRFIERTNVEFVHVEGPQAIRVNVWERGAGVTLACGTGACASAVAAIATGRAQATREGAMPVTVKLPGGELRIAWSGEKDSPVYMEGPAQEVFSGQYQIAD
jgi:diaminopimelate epimerase